MKEKKEAKKVEFLINPRKDYPDSVTLPVALPALPVSGNEVVALSPFCFSWPLINPSG